MKQDIYDWMPYKYECVTSFILSKPQHQLVRDDYQVCIVIPL